MSFYIKHSQTIKYRLHIHLVSTPVKTSPPCQISIFQVWKPEASDVTGFIRDRGADKCKDNSCRSKARAASLRGMILSYLHDFSFIDFSHDITPPLAFGHVWVRAKYQQLVSTRCVLDVGERGDERKAVCVGKYVRGSPGLRDICGSRGSLLGYQFSPSIMRQRSVKRRAWPSPLARARNVLTPDRWPLCRPPRSTYPAVCPSSPAAIRWLSFIVSSLYCLSWRYTGQTRPSHVPQTEGPRVCVQR